MTVHRRLRVGETGAFAKSRHFSHVVRSALLDFGILIFAPKPERVSARAQTLKYGEATLLP